MAVRPMSDNREPVSVEDPILLEQFSSSVRVGRAALPCLSGARLLDQVAAPPPPVLPPSAQQPSRSLCSEMAPASIPEKLGLGGQHPARLSLALQRTQVSAAGKACEPASHIETWELYRG